eukprot:Opistho-2@27292
MSRSHKLLKTLLHSKPEDRTLDEIEVIRKCLDGLACLRSVGHKVVRELAAKFELREYNRGDFIVKRNDAVAYWYIIISGEAVIRIDGDDFVRLYEGCSFGEQSWFAKGSRDVCVLAHLPCQILAVSRDYYKYMQRDARRGSVSASAPDAPSGGERRLSVATGRHDMSPSVSPQMTSLQPDSSPSLNFSPSGGAMSKSRSSFLGTITRTVHRMRRVSSPASMSDKDLEEPEMVYTMRSPDMRSDSICETPSSAASGDGHDNRAVSVASPVMSDSSGISFGGDYVKDALEKSPSERGARDIDTIMEEIQQMKAFSHFAPSLQRELCSVLSLDIVERAGTVLFRQGDTGTAWYITREGEVDVLVDERLACTLGEGNGFGDWALVNEKPRSATVVTKVDDCQFLKVEKGDYRRILKNLEQNTVRLSEFGRVVLVLENRLIGEKQKGFLVVCGTPDKLFERIGDQSDPFFVTDFLLTYRIFMTREDLWGRVLELFEAKSQDVALSRDVASTHTSPLVALSFQSNGPSDTLPTLRRVVWFVVNWVKSHWRDFADATSRERLHEFERRLAELADRNAMAVLRDDAAALADAIKTSAGRVRPFWTDALTAGDGAAAGGDGSAVSGTSSAPGDAATSLRIGRSMSSPTIVRKGSFSRQSRESPRESKEEESGTAFARRRSVREDDQSTTPEKPTVAQKRTRGFSVGSRSSTLQKHSSAGAVAASAAVAAAVAAASGSTATMATGAASARSGHLTEAVRIYTENNDSYRTIPIAAGAHVIDVLKATLERFNITGDETTHSIHETSLYEPLQRVLSNMDAAAGVEFSPEECEYTLRPLGHAVALSCDEMARSNHAQSRLLESDAKEIAWLLTMKDASMFGAVDDVQFVHYLYPTEEPGRGREKLTEMVQRFNDLTFWVVTEICYSKELSVRVQVVVQFIKIAKYCGRAATSTRYVRSSRGFSISSCSVWPRRGSECHQNTWRT